MQGQAEGTTKENKMRNLLLIFIDFHYCAHCGGKSSSLEHTHIT